MFKGHGVGRFVQQPELKYVKDTCVCEFSLAFNEYRKNKTTGESSKVPHFFDFVIWDKGAELMAQYCSKGDLIEVSVSPRQEKWESQDGSKRSKTVFRVDHFEFLPRSIKAGTPNDTADDTSDDTVDKTNEDVPF